MFLILVAIVSAGVVAWLAIEGYASHHEYREWLRGRERLRKAREQVKRGRRRYPIDIEALRKSHDKP